MGDRLDVMDSPRDISPPEGAMREPSSACAGAGGGRSGWRRALRGDPWIWAVMLALGALSLLEVYSVSEMLAYREHGGDTFGLFKQHLFRVVLGVGAAFFVQMFPTRHYRNWSVLLMVGSLLFLGYTMLFGTSKHLASRWVEITAGHGFQPSELVKLCLILFLASHLSRGKEYVNQWRHLLWILLPMVVSFWFILNDSASGAVFILGLSAVMLTMGQVSWQNLVILGLAGLVLALLLLFVVIPHGDIFKRGNVWAKRIEAFRAGSFQSDQAEIAIAGGMLLGKGVGNSSQRLILPEAHSDFIFACIVEELGLLGGTFVVTLYLLLLWRVRRIMSRSRKNLYQGYLCGGLGLMICLQAFAHIFISVGFIPVTGITLPFVSWGGTSLLVTGISFGIIQSVARQQAKELYEGEQAEL